MQPTIIGVSKNIIRIKQLIDQVADTGLNTIVYGETGVGKELVVQNLYQKSARVGKPQLTHPAAAAPHSVPTSPRALTNAKIRFLLYRSIFL